VQCLMDQAEGVLASTGCGCPADHEVKVASVNTKLYCDPCGVGDSRPVDQILVKAASACTAVAGKCSGNKVSATNLATLTASTYGFNCGDGYTVKSSAVAFSGADAAAQKAVCCTVSQCGYLASEGTTKVATCGCGTNEEIKQLSTNTAKLYCAACPSGTTRSASTTAVSVAAACTASTTIPATATTTSNSTTIPATATTTIAAGMVLVELTSKVTFSKALNSKNQTSIKDAFCKAVGTISDNVPVCSIKPSSRRRLLEDSVSYDLSATFAVSNTTLTAFSAKATARQETAKAEFLKDAAVLAANEGKAPTYVSSTVEVGGVKVTTAPTDDKKKDDWSGSSTLAVSFGVMCSMLL